MSSRRPLLSQPALATKGLRISLSSFADESRCATMFALWSAERRRCESMPASIPRNQTERYGKSKPACVSSCVDNARSSIGDQQADRQLSRRPSVRGCFVVDIRTADSYVAEKDRK